MKNIMEEKNNFSHISTDDLDDLDTRGIIPTKDFGYDFIAMREYCKKKGIDPMDMSLEELEQFSTI